ncbi:hypothetical protein B0H13DRAFT_1923873 [Mycena leptocephala]|nr:hypothetical protein B0H13DRAFT_1923873 [Mycena leptocephala]
MTSQLTTSVRKLPECCTGTTSWSNKDDVTAYWDHQPGHKLNGRHNEHSIGTHSHAEQRHQCRDCRDRQGINQTYAVRAQTSKRLGTTSKKLGTAKGILGTANGQLGTANGKLGTANGKLGTTNGKLGSTASGKLRTANGKLGSANWVQATTNTCLGTTDRN